MKRLVFLASLACFVCPLAAVAGDAGTQFLVRRVAGDPDDFIAWNQLGDRYLNLLRDGGDDELIGKASKAAEQSLRAIQANDNPGGVALQARVAIAGHRFAEGRQHAEWLVERFPDKDAYRLTLADALIELGEVDAADKLLQGLAEREFSPPDVEARWGRLEMVRGRLGRAAERYEAGLTACEQHGTPAPALVAWFHVLLGEIAFRRGDFVAAETHYDAARAAKPDDFGAADHSAELLAAEGKVDESIEAYQRLAADHKRPALFQAVGDLYAMKKDAKAAEEWHIKAAALYEASVTSGEMRYIHHLAGFYADSAPNPAKAVEYARKDLELRKTPQAWDALAWALYKQGEVSAAREAIRNVDLSHNEDAHILYHAGMIAMSAGELVEGRETLKRALQANPRYNSFHVHR